MDKPAGRDAPLRRRAAKVQPADVLTAAERLLQQRQELEKQNRQLKSGSNGQAVDLTPQQFEGVPVVVHRQDGAGAKAGQPGGSHRAATGSAVIVLAGVNEGKVLLLAKVTPDLVKQGIHAGNLVREVAN